MGISAEPRLVMAVPACHIIPAHGHRPAADRAGPPAGASGDRCTRSAGIGPKLTARRIRPAFINAVSSDSSPAGFSIRNRRAAEYVSSVPELISVSNTRRCTCSARCHAQDGSQPWPGSSVANSASVYSQPTSTAAGSELIFLIKEHQIAEPADSGCRPEELRERVPEQFHHL